MFGKKIVIGISSFLGVVVSLGSFLCRAAISSFPGVCPRLGLRGESRSVDSNVYANLWPTLHCFFMLLWYFKVELSLEHMMRRNSSDREGLIRARRI